MPTIIENTRKSYSANGATSGMLIHGDNLPAMQALLELGFAEKVDCIQIDPPYNTGYDFSDYNDSASLDSWKTHMEARIPLMYDLLSPFGFLLCYIDDTNSPELRATLNESFRRENYWGTFHINMKHSDPSMPDESPLIHRSMELLHVYQKSSRSRVLLPDGKPMSDYINGANLGDRRDEGGVKFRGGKKPEALIRFGYEHFSSPGSLVLDAYLGSGTGAAVAAKLRRPWIGICLDHMDSHSLPRLRRVVDGTDRSGISDEVAWKGGGGFVYYDVSAA